MTIASRHQSETGQTTVLVCAMLFTLTMFVALVVNVGQMVNRRVALQLIADAGAWSGATVQAAELNHYAFWSRMMQNAYVNASAVSFGFRFGECDSSVAAVLAYEYAQSGMYRAILNFYGKAYGAAYDNSMFNIDDLFPRERPNFSFATYAGPDEGSVLAIPEGNIAPLPMTKGDKLYTGDHDWSNETITQPLIEIGTKILSKFPWAVSKAGSGYESWPCATLLPPTAFTVYMPGPAGYKLQKLGQPWIFVWRVKENRATRALFFDKFLGPNAIPAMTAVAVAKAVGGNVQKGQSRYRAKMVPVSDYSLTKGIILDPQARTDRILPGTTRKILH